MFDFMPEAVSTWANKVDWINSLITYIATFCTVAITAVMLFFAVRYRRHSSLVAEETPQLTHSTLLETLWTAIPTVIIIFVFYFGLVTYQEMRNPPPNALEINVDAYKWRWEFTYPNTKKSHNELIVPVNKPIRLIMTSRDVLHSFFVPVMRVKEDVRPGAYSVAWFEATKVGEYRILCAEYCGTNHSYMQAKLKVVSENSFQDFLARSEVGEVVALPPSELGKELFNQRACAQCHSTDGRTIIGPSMLGLFGKTETLDSGEQVAVDEEYLRESILEPGKRIVKGYLNAMPSYSGQLSEEEIRGLIAYIKELRNDGQEANK